MAELGKVIGGLERMVEVIYNTPVAVWFAITESDIQTLNDALELLKESRPKVGEWVGYPDRLRHWHCSECGSVWGITAKVMYYCPNCGARMDMPDEWRKDLEA